MTKRFQGIRAFTNGSYRDETLLGKSYIVVPVVALVEGVLQGMSSAGPELALAEEFGRFPDGWNGRPVVMSHPVNKKGIPVSANSPAILEEYAIGILYNTKLDGDKLFTEAWVEVDRAETLNTNSQTALKTLQDGEMIEVSTGYFAQLEEVEGTHGDKAYIAIQRNIVPDHLAFLPNGTLGACSIEDGCGAPRMNSANQTQTFAINCSCEDAPAPTPTTQTGAQVRESRTFDDIEANDAKSRKKAKKQMDPKAYSLASIIAQSFPDAMLADDARMLVQKKLREQQGYSYVIGLTQNMVVYEQYDQISGYYKTYRRSYEVTAEGVVSLGDGVEEVNLITQVLPVVSDEPTPAANQEQSMTTETNKAPANSAAPAANVTDPKAPKVHTYKNDKGIEYKVTTNEDGTVASVEQITETPVVETPAPVAQETPKPVTLQEYVAQAPAEIQEVLQSGIKMQSQRRATLVAQLKSTNRCKFNDEQLKAFSLDQLEAMADLANIPHFEGSARPTIVSNADDETAPPPAPRAFEYGKPLDKQTA